MRRITAIATTLLTLAAASAAQAHFVFVRITPSGEGGRSAEVYFSEYATAGDPRYIDKVAGAKFWLQTTPGEFRPLEMHKLADRLRAHLPNGETYLVAGQLDYGVLSRPGQPPFLLRHYSKAVAGRSEDVNRLSPKQSRLEIIPNFKADGVELTALLDGKPMPEALFTTVDANLSNEELKADVAGRVTFAPSEPGYYCVYVQHVDRTAGEHDQKHYDEIREFATLSFAWPLSASGADAEAVKLFEDALAARAAWRNFPGFSAKIAGTLADRPFDGTVTVAADGAVTLKIDDEPSHEWVQDQLESITMHRAASSHDTAARPKPVLRFADQQTDHPLGRLLIFDGGHFASSYRVKDKQITVVNRVIGERNMTITVLHNEKNADGQYLPGTYSVQYWDEPSGKLSRTELVQDHWVRLGTWDLPAQHVLTTTADGAYEVRTFSLSGHQLNEPKASAKAD